MRVLILSVTAGFGHHATAKAIGDMLESKGAEVHTLDVYAYISNLIKTTIDKGYLFSSKHMQTLYRLVYQLADGDRVVMVEDVTTSGKSIDETYPKVMAAADVEVKGLIVSLNRMEVGKGGKVTAQQEIQEKYGFPVASIVSMEEVVEALDGSLITPELHAAIDEYYAQYGVK